MKKAESSPVRPLRNSRRDEAEIGGEEMRAGRSRGESECCAVFAPVFRISCADSGIIAVCFVF